MKTLVRFGHTALMVAFMSFRVSATSLGDAPPLAQITVPPNMMLALSVEFPTGDLAAYKGIPDAVAGYTCGGLNGSGYAICFVDNPPSDPREYIGIFDPRKCYDYEGDPGDAAGINALISAQSGVGSGKVTPGYFYPVSLVNGLSTTAVLGSGSNYSDIVITTQHTCNGQTNPANGHYLWSGHYLNWVAMHVIDEFRWTLTGGDRIVDTTASSADPVDFPAITVLEKTRHDGQGGYADYPIHVVQNVNATTTGTPPGASSSVTFTVPAVTISNYVPASIYPSNTSALYARALTGSGSLNPPYTATNSSGSAIGQGTLAVNDMYDASNVTDTSAVSQGRAIQFATNSGFTANVRTYMMRVKVCDYALQVYSGVPMEPNCQQYNNSWKPTGLIQNNIGNIRVGAAGYLLDNTQGRPGGVVRARMHDLGLTTIVPNGTGVANPNAEITADGVFVQNPDAADATASSTASGLNINHSGVFNYLNKFGKTNGYKTYDTLGEMYYEALRYLHLDPTDDTYQNSNPPVRRATPEYTNTSTVTQAMYDNFPIVTNWANDDPIEWYCQKNVIVGIADTNTWLDSSVPGFLPTITRGQENSGHPYLPLGRDTAIYNSTSNNLLTAFQAMDAAESTTYAGGAGYTFNGSGTNASSSNHVLFEQAGSVNSGTTHTWVAPALAYWANVNDVRPLFPNKPSSTKITVQTYFVDVMEAGVSTNGPNAYNWAWLASKYGGFNDDGHKISWTSGGNSYSYPAPDTISSWQSGTTGLPTNYFQGQRPDYMRSGLQSIFTAVLGSAQTNAGASLGSAQLSSGGGNSAFTSEYNPNGWYTQQLYGEQLSLNVTTNAPSVTQVWNAAVNLDTQVAPGTQSVSDSAYTSGTDTARRIVTMGSSGSGVPFRWSNLTSTQQTALGSQNVLNYLRGDRANEINWSGALTQSYRSRTHLLGDIIDSQAVSVSVPSMGISDPGYASFATANANRTPAIYVGANDGMLHAFNAVTTTGTTTGGYENWAYIPSFVINVPHSGGSPSNYGIGFLANPNYTHRYYVDQTPQVADIDFCNTVSGRATPLSSACSAHGYDWHTVLIGGLNKGGKGFYALDVTNPGTTSDSESTVAQRVMWEFTDPDMGYSFGNPTMVKTTQYGWVVLLTSGYNNTSGSNPGKGFLYVVDPRNGSLIQKIGTGVGSSSSPSGLGKGQAFIPVATNYVADYAYYGDLQGNIWRFDLTTASGAYPAPLLFAKLTDPSGNPQPITAKLYVDVDTNGINRYVFAVTGQFLSAADESTSQQQTFYAFKDGSRYTPYSSSNLPPSGSFPLGRNALTQFTATEITGAGGTIAGSTSGWYFDLPGNSGPTANATERGIEDITANFGVVTWATMTPANPNIDVCAPSGTGAIYSVRYATGKSVLANIADGNTILNFTSNSPVLNPQFVSVDGVTVRQVYSSSTGQLQGLNQNDLTGDTPVRGFWKEIFE